MRSKSILAALILAILLAVPAPGLLLRHNRGPGPDPVTHNLLAGGDVVAAGSLHGSLGGRHGPPPARNDGPDAGEVSRVDLAPARTIPTAAIEPIDPPGEPITLLPDPDPGTIVLLGLGLSLVGFGFVRKQG